MLKNYFTIAFRNLRKNKAFSLINIAGLAIGMTCCAILALYIQDELSYDRHFDGAERIYRVTTTMRQTGSPGETFQRTAPPVAMTMLQEFPELESATRIVNPPEVEQHLLKYNDDTFYQRKGFLVDSTFLDVFSLELREGNPRTALKARSSVILSDATAKKLFADKPALNETLIITSGWSVDTFQITGVLKPTTKKSHINADFYINMNSKGWGDLINSMTTWSGNNFMFSYIKLRPGAAASDLQKKFPALLDKYGAEELKATKREKEFGLQPLADVHLHSSHFAFNLDLAENGSITYIYVMATVAAFILLIACINFINMTTARAAQRAGEVGVRKTMGANRTELIAQFLGESFTVVIMAMLLAAGLIQAALPFFNSFAVKDLSLQTGNVIQFGGILFLLAVVTAVIAGSYPAFFLSSFQPAAVLKNKKMNDASSQWLRKSLVIAQFVIAITLIGSSIVIREQLTFVQNKELGYDADYKIMLPLRTQEARQTYETLKKEFGQITGVKTISASTSLPSTPVLRDIPVYAAGQGMENARQHFMCNIDEGYFELLNIPVLLGRALDQSKDGFDFNGVSIHVMVNHASLREMGIADKDALGSVYKWSGKVPETGEDKTYEFEIVGVVEDYHYASLHKSIKPMMYLLPKQQNAFVFMAMSLDTKSYENVLPQLESVWKRNVPSTPFETIMLSDNVQRLYEEDRQVSMVISVFTGIAIALSCLGLYGLSLYVGERRTKEIGIRKVLGATTFSIVRMLSMEFTVLLGIALVIAVPLGYYAMEGWLANFAYKIDLNVLYFIAGGLASFMVAWFTVGFEAVRAATSNPVDSLKND